MTDAGDAFAAQRQALDSYFEALLGVGEAAQTAAGDTGEGSAESRRGDGVPAWARPDFEAGLFRVHGLKLAIPILNLVGVEPYPEVVTPVEGAHPWRLGRFATGGCEATLIDLGSIVIPARYGGGPAGSARPGERVILCGDGEWAFACEQDVEIVTLEARHVRWATRRTSRRWLAGTVMAHGCGLLDVDGLIAQVEEGEAPSLA